MAEYMSFDEVLHELKIGEEELKRMVSENEIRALHDGDTLRFRRDEVLELKKSKETEPTIVLADDEEEFDLSEIVDVAEEKPEPVGAASTDETVLNIEGLLEEDLSELGEEGVPEPAAAPLASSATDELNLLEDDAGLGTGGETVLDAGVLELEDEDTFQLEAGDEELLSEEEVGVRAPRARPMQVRRKEGNPLMVTWLAVTTVALLGPGAVLLNLMAKPEGVYPEWIESLFFGSIGKAIADLFF